MGQNQETPKRKEEQGRGGIIDIMSLSKTETDVILNKANVALARSQRLVASWLPPKTQEEQANTKSEEALQQEEDEVFTAVPET